MTKRYYNQFKGIYISTLWCIMCPSTGWNLVARKGLSSCNDPDSDAGDSVATDRATLASKVVGEHWSQKLPCRTRLASDYSAYSSPNEATTIPLIRINKLTTFAYRTLKTIWFWNLMTLNDDDSQNARILQLNYEFLRYNLEVLGISETKWFRRVSVKTPSCRTLFLYSGKKKLRCR